MLQLYLINVYYFSEQFSYANDDYEKKTKKKSVLR